MVNNGYIFTVHGVNNWSLFQFIWTSIVWLKPLLSQRLNSKSFLQQSVWYQYCILKKNIRNPYSSFIFDHIPETIPSDLVIMATVVNIIIRKVEHFFSFKFHFVVCWNIWIEHFIDYMSSACDCVTCLYINILNNFMHLFIVASGILVCAYNLFQHGHIFSCTIPSGSSFPLRHA